MAQGRSYESFDLPTVGAERLIEVARGHLCLYNVEILKHRDALWKENGSVCGAGRSRQS